MRSLPLAARVNGWFFAHAGSTSHMSLDTLAGNFRTLVDSGLQQAGAYRVYDDPADPLRHLDEVGVREPSP